MSNLINNLKNLKMPLWLTLTFKSFLLCAVFLVYILYGGEADFECTSTLEECFNFIGMKTYWPLFLCFLYIFVLFVLVKFSAWAIKSWKYWLVTLPFQLALYISCLLSPIASGIYYRGQPVFINFIIAAGHISDAEYLDLHVLLLIEIFAIQIIAVVLNLLKSHPFKKAKTNPDCPQGVEEGANVEPENKVLDKAESEESPETPQEENKDS